MVSDKELKKSGSRFASEKFSKQSFSSQSRVGKRSNLFFQVRVSKVHEFSKNLAYQVGVNWTP